MATGNSTRHPANYKGGYSRPYTREYKTWQSMRGRCNDPNDPYYARYGGRGITICDRWRIFTNFLADMGPRPAGHTIDRIDNDGDYCPENCRWATATDQQRNTRQNRRITYNGRTQCLTAWAEEYGIKPHTLTARLKRGWIVHQALTIPVGRKR